MYLQSRCVQLTIITIIGELILCLLTNQPDIHLNWTTRPLTFISHRIVPEIANAIPRVN